MRFLVVTAKFVVVVFKVALFSGRKMAMHLVVHSLTGVRAMDREEEVAPVTNSVKVSGVA